MTHIADLIMLWRSRKLHARLAHHLSTVRTLADIGSGTGHNAWVIRQKCEIDVAEFDVADLHWIGPGPQLFDGVTLPLANKSCDVSLMLYVLHYSADPSTLLREAFRVARTRVILLQSTSEPGISRRVLMVREWITGRLAFWLARGVNIIQTAGCPLVPHWYFNRTELERLIAQAGLRIVAQEKSIRCSLLPSRDLYILEQADAR